MAAQIGRQLFIVREHLARVLAGTLARVSAMGYAGVEARVVRRQPHRRAEGGRPRVSMPDA